MITRVTLFKWKPGCTQDQIAEVFKDAMDLKKHIPNCNFELRCGKNVGKDPDGGFTHIIVGTFDNHATLAVYQDHPAHVAVVDKIVKIRQDYLLLQMET